MSLEMVLEYYHPHSQEEFLGNDPLERLDSAWPPDSPHEKATCEWVLGEITPENL